MRRWLIAVLGGYLAFAACGCSWARSPEVVKAITDSETAQTIARDAVADASKAFADLLAQVPEANRPAFKKRFDDAMKTYAEADKALTSARTAFRAATEPKPDYAKAFGALVDAVRGVIQVVDIVTAAGPTAATPDAKPHPALVSAYGGLHQLERK